MTLPAWQQHIVDAYNRSGKAIAQRRDDLTAIREPQVSRVIEILEQRGRTEDVLGCADWSAITRMTGGHGAYAGK